MTDPMRTAAIPAAVLLVAVAVWLAPTDADGHSRLSLLPPLALNAFVADGLSGFAVSRLGELLVCGAVAALTAASALGYGLFVPRECEQGKSEDELREESGGEPDAPNADVHLPLAAAIGLVTHGWLTFVLGSVGLIGRPVAAAIVGGGLALLAIAFPRGMLPRWSWRIAHPVLASVCGLVLLVTFVGATTPSRDFDVREYHLEGPKEWSQTGQIVRLDHNVYTSFPTLAEMLTLEQFSLAGGPNQQWAKAVAWLFVPITASLLLAFGRRWSSRVGWLAAAIYLTVPWAGVMAEVAYVEGPFCLFALAALLAAIDAQGRGWTMPDGVRVGVLAGAACAVKYPGVVYVAIPLIALVGWQAIRRRASWLTVATALGGIGLVFGPWLLKNAIETGNPVYPLASSIFGGVGLDADWVERWGDAHAAKVPWSRPWLIPGDLVASLWQVLVGSGKQSPLVATGLVAGLAAVRGDRAVRWAAAHVAVIFAVYWVATHRIDRFWLPLLPAASLVAAVGFDRMLAAAGWVRGAAAALVMTGLAWSVLMLLAITPDRPLRPFSKQHAEAVPPLIALLNDTAPDSRVLLVGEAQVFDATFDPVYATVFDRSPLEQIATENGRFASPDTICERLRKRGIELIAANWQEVLRYRLTYRTTDVDSQHTIDRLLGAGILEPVPIPPERSLLPTDSLDENERRELAAIGVDITGPAWQRLAVYRVTCD